MHQPETSRRISGYDSWRLGVTIQKTCQTHGKTLRVQNYELFRWKNAGIGTELVYVSVRNNLVNINFVNIVSFITNGGFSFSQ
jgi:hypothetical protein